MQDGVNICIETELNQTRNEQPRTGGDVFRHKHGQPRGSYSPQKPQAHLPARSPAQRAGQQHRSRKQACKAGSRGEGVFGRFPDPARWQPRSQGRRSGRGYANGQHRDPPKQISRFLEVAYLPQEGDEVVPMDAAVATAGQPADVFDDAPIAPLAHGAGGYLADVGHLPGGQVRLVTFVGTGDVLDQWSGHGDEPSFLVGVKVRARYFFSRCRAASSIWRARSWETSRRSATCRRVRPSQ